MDHCAWLRKLKVFKCRWDRGCGAEVAQFPRMNKVLGLWNSERSSSTIYSLFWCVPVFSIFYVCCEEVGECACQRPSVWRSEGDVGTLGIGPCLPRCSGRHLFYCCMFQGHSPLSASSPCRSPGVTGMSCHAYLGKDLRIQTQVLNTWTAITLPTKRSLVQYCSFCKLTHNTVNADMNHGSFTSFLYATPRILKGWASVLGIVLRALCELFNLTLSQQYKVGTITALHR